MTTEYDALLSSHRVSPQTRAVLLARQNETSASDSPGVLTPEEFRTLQAVLARIIPQSTAAGPMIDLAGRLHTMLATGKGDGWRYAILPPDLEACRLGIALLDEFARILRAKPFHELNSAAQEALLSAIAAGRLHSARLAMKQWFEDLRAAATQLYVAHPKTLARLGYSGIADDPNGFVQIGIGQVEAWEPQPE